MKDYYSVQIPLRCMTCGASYAFETDDVTGRITCHKCNRVYYGGEEELIRLNEALIEDEKERLLDEVRKDVENELKNMFKKIGFK